MVTDLRITPTYDLLLRGSDELPIGLYQLHLATAEQLTRLHYSMGSINKIKERLKDLTDAGYVRSDALLTKKGNGGYYYWLTDKGASYLRSAGYDILKGWRPIRHDDQYGLFVRHTLEINDVIVAASLLHKADPRYHLASFTHDKVLKRELKGSVIPDAFLDFRASVEDKRLRRPVLLEHDRGTEEQGRFKAKIQGYVSLLKSGDYQQLFGASKITIIFTTFVSQQRFQQMLQWTYEELRGEPEEVGYRFRFAYLTKPLDPMQVWFEPIWYTPYGQDAISLLRMS